MSGGEGKGDGRLGEGAQIISLLHSILSAIVLVRITTPSAEITTLALHVVPLLLVSPALPIHFHTSASLIFCKM